ncbi:MAG: hypothetical protein WED05_10250 [Candidatus Atabeyarchaeum deiterrae]
MPAVTHFYIATEAGTCIYARSTNGTVSQDLLPGFMTAMNSFASKVMSGSLESVGIGRSKYFVLSSHGLLFIVRTDLNAKATEVRRELEELQVMFFSNFSAERHSSNWDALSQISPALDVVYDSYFKESDQKMREAIW